MPDKGTAATAIYSDGKFIGYGAYNQYAIILTDVHNADCDAYEKRIAELEADLDNANAIATWVDGLQSELARVKAESLRVVYPDTETVNASDPRFFVRVAGSILWQRIREADRFGQVSAFDVRNTDVRCRIPATEQVHPVRLEPWEK